MFVSNVCLYLTFNYSRTPHFFIHSVSETPCLIWALRWWQRRWRSELWWSPSTPSRSILPLSNSNQYRHQDHLDMKDYKKVRRTPFFYSAVLKSGTRWIGLGYFLLEAWVWELSVAAQSTRTCYWLWPSSDCIHTTLQYTMYHTEKTRIKWRKVLTCVAQYSGHVQYPCKRVLDIKGVVKVFMPGCVRFPFSSTFLVKLLCSFKSQNCHKFLQRVIFTLFHCLKKNHSSYYNAKW